MRNVPLDCDTILTGRDLGSARRRVRRAVLSEPPTAPIPARDAWDDARHGGGGTGARGGGRLLRALRSRGRDHAPLRSRQGVHRCWRHPSRGHGECSPGRDVRQRPGQRHGRPGLVLAGLAPHRRRTTLPRARVGGGSRDGVRRRRSRPPAGCGATRAGPGPPLRRREPRDQGPGRCRPGPRPGRSPGRRDGPARRGHGPGLRPGRQHGRRQQVRVLVLHRLLLRGRLRPGRLVERPAASAGVHRPREPASALPGQPLRQRAGHAAHGARALG